MSFKNQYNLYLKEVQKYNWQDVLTASIAAFLERVTDTIEASFDEKKDDD